MLRIRSRSAADSTDLGAVTHKHGEAGENDLSTLAPAHCTQFRRALDVGAAAGSQTEDLAERFAWVEAFEPCLVRYDCLTNTASRRSVTRHRIALGSVAVTRHVINRMVNDGETGWLHDVPIRGTVPVECRTIDSFNWDDVDLIRVAGASDFSSVLEGAALTMQRSRPVIWLSKAKGAGLGEHMALALGEYGYRRVEVRGGDAVYRAVAPSAQKYEAVVLTQEMGNPLLAWREPVSNPGAPIDSGWALHGRFVTTVKSGRQVTNDGPALATIMSVSRKFDPAVSESVRRPGKADFHPSAQVVGFESLAELLAARVTCRVNGDRLKLHLPWQCAPLFRSVAVEIRQPGPQRIVFRQALSACPNLSAIDIRLPLDQLTQAPCEAIVSLSGPDRPTWDQAYDIRWDPAAFHAESINVYQNRGGGGLPVIRAMASAIGARVLNAENGYVPGVSVVWGVLRGSMDVIRAAVAANAFYYYIDHAYFSRGHLKNYRITRNRFEAGPLRQVPFDRAQRLQILARPWEHSGRHVVVCPPTAYFAEAHDCANWLEDTLSELRMHTDRDIIVREKPKPGEAATPLSTDLQGAHALVTHSSNVAIEAVCAGVPVFVSPSSAAAPVGLTDLSEIERPVYPDRRPWLAHLAYSQFTMAEIESGEAWRLLRDFEDRDLL